MRPVLGIVQCRWQHRDVAGDLAQSKYCTMILPSFFSAAFWSSRYIGAPA